MTFIGKSALLGWAFFASATAMAQTSAFSGAAVGASVNLLGASFKYTEIDKDYLTIGDQNVGLALTASYGLDLSPETVVLLGADLDFTEKHIYRTSESKNYSNLKNSLSFYIAPGKVINEHTLVYGKLSLETTKFSIGSKSSTTILTKEEAISGVGIGFGVRNKINNDLILQTEIKRVNYKEVDYFNDKIEPSTTSGSVGLLYKF